MTMTFIDHAGPVGSIGRLVGFFESLLSDDAPGDLSTGPAIRVWVDDAEDAPAGRVTHRCPGGLHYYDVPLPDLEEGCDCEPDSFVYVEAVNPDDPDSQHPHGLMAEKSWMPYQGPRGGDGWRNLDTGDVVYQDEPPGETAGSDPGDDPLSEGDVVVLEYDGETHYGRVIKEYPDGEVAVQDDRNNWKLQPDEASQIDGAMEVTNIGQPESDQQDPADMVPDSPDDLAYAMDELGPDEAVDKLAESLDHMDMDDVVEGVKQSNQMSLRLAGGRLMEEHGSVRLDGGGTVTPDPAEHHVEELQQEFSERVDEDAEQTVNAAARGWEGSMYKDRRTAPLVQKAMEETGNETLPEYDFASTAAGEWIPDRHKEAIEELQKFTTEKLREAYGDEVVVFRGMSRNPHGGTPSSGTSIVSQLERATAEGFDDLEPGDPGEMVRGDHLAVEHPETGETVPAEYLGQNDDGTFEAILNGERMELDEDMAVFGEEVEIEHRPVESWTLNPDTAALYASGGALIKQKIPVENVVMSSSTGHPHPAENDTVVQHEGPQRYDPDDILTGDDIRDEENMFRMKAEVAKETRT